MHNLYKGNLTWCLLHVNKLILLSWNFFFFISNIKPTNSCNLRYTISDQKLCCECLWSLPLWGYSRAVWTQSCALCCGMALLGDRGGTQWEPQWPSYPLCWELRSPLLLTDTSKPANSSMKINHSSSLALVWCFGLVNSHFNPFKL